MALQFRTGTRALGLWLIAGCSFDSIGGSVGQNATGGPEEGSTAGETGVVAPTSDSSDSSESGAASESSGAVDPTTGAVDPSTTGGETTNVDPSTTGGETTNVDPSTTSSETTNVDPSTTSETTNVDPSTSTGEEACVELDPEPNDDPMNMVFVDHGNIECKDDAMSFMGTLLDEAAIDWHFYTGDDGGGSQCDSQANIVTTIDLEAEAPVRVCAYAYCMAQNSSTQVNCQTGTKVPNYPGCCLNPATSGELRFDLNCTNSGNESAWVYVGVDQAQAECVDYTIEYDWDN